MVHALDEAWRVLCLADHKQSGPPFRNGLIDIRPQPGDPMVVVYSRDGEEINCGPLRSKESGYNRHQSAEQALKTVAEAGKFSIAEARAFEWIDEYESADELSKDVDEGWSTRMLDEDTALALMHALDRLDGAGTAIIRQSIRIRFLRKLNDAS